MVAGQNVFLDILEAPRLLSEHSWMPRLARLIGRHRIATLDRRPTELQSVAFIKITIIRASDGGSANFMPLKRVHRSI